MQSGGFEKHFVLMRRITKERTDRDQPQRDSNKSDLEQF